MKTLKGLIAFAVFVIAPIIFFIYEPGMSFLKSGKGWILYVLAPIQSFLFTLVAYGWDYGKKVGKDDGGNLLLNFWSIFGFLALILIGVAYLLIREA